MVLRAFSTLCDGTRMDGRSGPISPNNAEIVPNISESHSPQRYVTRAYCKWRISHKITPLSGSLATINDSMQCTATITRRSTLEHSGLARWMLNGNLLVVRLACVHDPMKTRSALVTMLAPKTRGNMKTFYITRAYHRKWDLISIIRVSELGAALTRCIH